MLPAVPSSNMALLPGCGTLGGVVALWDGIACLVGSGTVHERQRDWELFYVVGVAARGDG